MQSAKLLALVLVLLAVASTVPSASADGIISRAFKRLSVNEVEKWAADKLDLEKKDIDEFVDKLQENRIDASTLYHAWQDRDLDELLKKMNLGYFTRRRIEKAINSFFENEESVIGSLMDSRKGDLSDRIKHTGKEMLKSKFMPEFTLNPFSWAWWGFSTLFSLGFSIFKFTVSFFWTLVTSPIRTGWLFADLLGLAFLLTRKMHSPSYSPDSTEPTNVEVKVPHSEQVTIDRVIHGFNWLGRMIFGDRVWGTVRYGIGMIPRTILTGGQSALSKTLLYSRAYARSLLGGEDSKYYGYVKRAGNLGLEAFAWSTSVLSFYSRVRHYLLFGFAVWVLGSVISLFVPSIVLAPIRSLVWRIGDIGFLYMAWSFMRWHTNKDSIAKKHEHVDADRSSVPDQPVSQGIGAY